MAKTKERTDKRAGGNHPAGKAGERTARNDAGPAGGREHLVELYRRMVLVRNFEKACQRSFRSGKIGGYLHLYTGQEAVAAGFLSAFRPGDRVITGYRDHAHALLLGCEPGAVMAELYGRRDGLVRGKGGVHALEHRLREGGAVDDAAVEEIADGARDEVAADGPGDGPVRLSINDFVMKACALALRTFPKLNSWWTADGIELHQRVDLAMAVALEDGLITPVIRNAAERTLSAISIEARELAARARSGKLRPDEYQGGTFTVSNMGMYGVESFTAIVNSPSVSIVAVSAVARRPDFDATGEVVPRSVLKLTIGSDHRAVNGAENARYLAEVKRLLEHPLPLAV